MLRILFSVHTLNKRPNLATFLVDFLFVNYHWSITWMHLRQSPSRVSPALHPDGLRGVHGGGRGVAVGGGGHGGEPS